MILQSFYLFFAWTIEIIKNIAIDNIFNIIHSNFFSLNICNCYIFYTIQLSINIIHRWCTRIFVFIFDYIIFCDIFLSVILIRDNKKAKKYDVWITLHIPLPKVKRCYHIIVLRILLSLLFHNELHSFKMYIYVIIFLYLNNINRTMSAILLIVFTGLW